MINQIDKQLSYYIELQGSSEPKVIEILNNNPEIEQTSLFTDMYLESRALSVIPNFECVVNKQDVKVIKTFALEQFIEYGKSYDTIYSELIDMALDKYNEIVRKLNIQSDEIKSNELLLTMNIDKQRSEIEYNLRMIKINDISTSRNFDLLS